MVTLEHLRTLMLTLEVGVSVPSVESTLRSVVILGGDAPMIEPGQHQIAVVNKFVGLPYNLIGDSMG
jgi:hypothetical protein